MTFERNDGQLSGQYRFMFRHQGVQALFSAEGPDFHIPQGNQGGRPLGMRFLSAAGSPVIEGEHQLTGRANYLRGRQAEKWITSVPTFGQVRYSNLYPGIDLLFHADGSGSELEHDFVVAPGADPRSIRFEMRGADTVSLRPNGQLIIEAQGNSLIFHQALAYQETPNGRVPVRAEFRLDAHRVVSFHLGRYDHRSTLTIDPVLSFSTYLDGNNDDTLRALTSDASGNIYAAGTTTSTGFPLSNAEQPTNMGDGDVFISKLDPTGHTLIYSTYLGGSNTDEAESIAVDANGDVVVSGTSLSNNFPQAGQLTSTLSGYSETFVASLNAAGNTLRYSGFLGANDPVQQDDYTRLSRVALDTQGSAYVTGLTDDPTFTVTPGAYGGPVAPYPSNSTLFIVKVQPDGSFGYKATIPQTPPQQIGSNVLPLSIGNIAVDSTGAVILGGSAGNDVPTTAGTLSPAFPNSLLPVNATAGFALKLNAAGNALAFSTYLPGTDTVTDVALDPSGDIYLAGLTYESTLPTSANALQKALIPRGATGSSFNAGFVFKLSSSGTTTIDATYFEGTTPQSPGDTDIRGLVVDAAGNVNVGGATQAADLPLRNPLISVPNTVGSGDLYLAQLSADLSTLQFGTFLNANDLSAQFAALAATPSGHILLSGSTFSVVFPTTTGAFQPTPPPPLNPLVMSPRVFIAGIDLSVAAPSLCFDTATVNFGAVLVNTIADATVNVTNCGNAPLTLASATSSDPTVTLTQNCRAIAPANVCQLQLAYAPTAPGSVQGSLTLSGNNAISPQLLSFAGTAGYPQATLPSSLSFDDLLVGETGSSNGVAILNQGFGAFILTSATITGDFQITQNSCNKPVPPQGGICGISINFSPTAAGPRTGVLTLTDNLTPSVQTIALSGNGLTSAPAPTVSTILATLAAPSGTGALFVYGAGFFPNSTVLWNGQPRTTHYNAESELAADLLSADIQQVAEAQVAVTTPGPGGGTSATSAATIYGRLQNIQVVNEVFEPHSQLIYATISKTSPANANSVVAIDPVMMKVVKTVLTGNGPEAIAVSEGGSMLYVGLNDTLSVTQISLPGGTQNFTVQLPTVSLNSIPVETYPTVASALKVVPAQPHTWLAGLCEPSGEPCGLGVAVFDDATVRPTQENLQQLTANSFVFVNDPTVVYSTEFSQSPPDISAYKISSSGITRTAISPFEPGVGGSPLESDGSLIYDSAGQVIDPSTLVTHFTYPQASSGFPQPIGGFALDTANQRLYFAGAVSVDSLAPFGGDLLLTAVGQTTKSTIGQIYFPEESEVAGVERFGTNGLAINQGNQWLFLKTSLTGTTIPVESVAVSPASLSFGAQTQGTTSAPQTVTLANTGTAALSISGITTTGDYSQTNNCGTSLAISASCAIRVSFTPAATGDRTGQLTIADNGPGNTQSVPLDGTGSAPGSAVSASVSPASLSFGSQTQGTTSAAQKVTLANTGAAVLSISGITTTGDYSQTNNCGTSLAVSASCLINVSFTPAAAGDRTGQLNIADNAPGTPQAVSLDGTGTASVPPLILAPQSSGGNTATVNSGGTVTYNLILTTATYSGVVGLSCAGAPAPATCSVNPAAPHVTAGAPASFVVTVTTASAGSSAQSAGASSRPNNERGQMVSAGLGLATLLTFPVILSIRRHRSIFVGLMLLGVAIGFGLAGCGSGSPANFASQANTVAAGTYQLTITAAAGNQTAAEVLTLTVK
jgi:Abnormal spindle-like microcephaly-assoc'd, ASPM-SPD-2-Hydin/Beta-propeller repeat